MALMTCRICKNHKGNDLFVAREMMYGSMDEFEYFHCDRCGCLQIREYPMDLSKYYPKDYYSYMIGARKNGNAIVRYLRRQRARYGITGGGIVGMIVEKVMKKPLMFDLLRECNVKFSSSVLDIGSGAGTFLFGLHRIGFRRLTGFDPFIDRDLNYDEGVRIVKGSLSDLDGEYDLIIMKDSLEHIPGQHKVLSQVHRLLNTGGALLVIMPIVGYAWRTYGTNWVGLDAPRHLYIHSLRSMEILFEKVGFRMRKKVYDSNEDQFIGSEQYERNITMFDKRSYYVDPQGSMFSDEQIASYREKAALLNRSHDGDRICVILEKNV